MAIACRLCGDLKPDSELLINIQEEQENVKFCSLIEYFCRIELSTDPSLSPLACKSCKSSLESFTQFCDNVQKHQLELEHQFRLKKELALLTTINGAKDSDYKESGIETFFSVRLIDEPATAANEDVESSISDMTSDAASTATGDAESIASASHSSSRLRKKNIQTKNCTVLLERVNISFVETDTEDELNSSGDEGDLNSSLTSVMSVESIQQSPSKRMRLELPESKTVSPKSLIIPTPIEKESKPATTIVKSEPLDSSRTVRTTFSENYHRHRSLFANEFRKAYTDSVNNLPVPKSHKSSDGSIHDHFSVNYFVWSSLKLKCNVKACSRLEFTSNEMLVHKKTTHQDSDNLVKCSNCKSHPLEVFDIISFMQHAINCHNRLLRYSCFGCSKIFFNFTALFIHYNSCNSALLMREFCMCLRDGAVFQDFDSLESHIADHKRDAKMKKKKAKQGSLNIIKKSAKIVNPIALNRKDPCTYCCEMCNSKFSSAFDLERHNLTHVPQLPTVRPTCEICGKIFPTNFSLNRHKESHVTPEGADSHLNSKTVYL